MELNEPVLCFSPFPELETERLVLRRITRKDLDEVFAIRSDAGTMQYIPRPVAKTSQDAIDYLNIIEKGIVENEFIHWAICHRTDRKLVGMICLLRFQLEDFRAELGYILSAEHRKMGIMAEAVEAVITYAFGKLNLHSLEAVIDPANAASEQVLLRKGFVKEAHFKEKRFWNGEFLDDVVYSLLNTRTV